MNQDKMHIVNKLFNNETIRTVWDNEKETYYISVVDIVRVLTDSTNPQTYWRVLKKRLKDEGNETVTNCNALKLKSKDGKYRLTDVVDTKVMFRNIKSILFIIKIVFLFASFIFSTILLSSLFNILFSPF